MESSEDDAGAATNASRRASAREKDVGKIEDVNATCSMQQESSEPRTSCETPAMSEDNFDGDSVPSPSTQDVNTSTEAILDMIDEIVDGPGAPKRLPLSLENDTDSRFAGGGDTSIASEDNKSCHDPVKAPSCVSDASAKIEEIKNVEVVECAAETQQSAVLADVKEDCVELPEASSSVLKIDNSMVSIDTDKLEASCSEEPCASLLPNIPSSSVVQAVESLPETVGEVCERTVKCVTSSDNRDNVVVESAESTSSDNSISEVRIPVTEPVTRSPLRRRLVRPAPNRPDSTVSSTVDSSINVQTSEQASECVIKDVSSSSDAVSSVQSNVTPEEPRNVSEISVCKAETSVSPTKKIKLIRQKVVPHVSHTQVENAVELPEVVTESEPCQSTSCDQIAALETQVSLTESSGETFDNITTSKTDNECTLKTESLPISSQEQISETIIEESTNKNSQNSEDEHKPSTSSPQIEEPLKDSIYSEKRLPPLKINISVPSLPESPVEKIVENLKEANEGTSISNFVSEETDIIKQVPKLTIKLGAKHNDEMKSPVPKLTIKPIKPPPESESHTEEQIPHVTKLNIKPITKPPEKINEIHRKSSSSEISESEYSENDESNSTSDQASASDQGSTDIVPKVTIKLGKPGTESEGQFYTEKNIPKLTIKAIQHSETEPQVSPSKLKVVISQSEDKQTEKIPKLTIKTVGKCDSQPLSPKLTIKPIKPPEDLCTESTINQTQEIPKLKITTDTSFLNIDSKDSVHVPKITIKPITKSEAETSKSKKPVPYENSENIPVVKKLNIKPIIKPTDNTELSDGLEDKVPVVSKVNIKPIVKPKDSDVDFSKDDVPKIMKLNIKPLKSPEINSSEEKDCDDLKLDVDENSISITKLNIKPIVKPVDEDNLKDNDNQSSETENSSDDNNDQIPVVTKLNIKPICKPNDKEESGPSMKKEENIPAITKLNIKPLIKPDESVSPLSPKKEPFKCASPIPTITKLNIKPVLKPEEIQQKSDDKVEETIKNPPLLMKINRKTGDSYVSENQYSINKNDHDVCNSVNETIPVVSKIHIKPIVKPSEVNLSENINQKESITNNEVNKHRQNVVNDLSDCEVNEINSDSSEIKENCVASVLNEKCHDENKSELPTDNTISDSKTSLDPIVQERSKCAIDSQEISSDIKNTESNTNKKGDESVNNSHLDLALNISSKTNMCVSKRSENKNVSTRQNCTLLKKLLETHKENDQDDVENVLKVNKIFSPPKTDAPKSPTINMNLKNELLKEKLNADNKNDFSETSHNEEATNEISCNMVPMKVQAMPELSKEANANLTKPLEISISDKVSHQSPDQDSPRIILKINKTEQGASAKIITEEVKKPEQHIRSPENTQEVVNDSHLKKNLMNSRRMPHVDTPMPMGKRLRSSRILQTPEKTPVGKRNMNKRPITTETSPPQNKETELSVLETKRLKLGQLLSNKSLTITPIVASKASQVSPPIKSVDNKQSTRNYSLLNNENCAKNGSSKLHNILSNLQAKQLQTLPFNDLNHTENSQSISPDLKSSTSTESPDLISENISMEKSRPEVHEMLFHENSESRDFSSLGSEELAQDPLDVDNLRSTNDFIHDNIPKTVEVMTPQPKRRGRPRKLPVSEGARPVILPVTALEERPQRSLRLSRDRPVILVKPRGRGRGRGRRLEPEPSPTQVEPVAETANKFFAEQKPEEEIDPTSSRIKLPRMTEALDKMPSVCSTPLTSRRRTSSSELQLFGKTQEVKVVLESTLPKMEDPFLKSPEILGEARGRGGRGGRGSRGGRGRTPARSPRARGRGRGGGRGAMYMKETMGIYGRVCGPATTTVQLFEEETCMMDDNATPAKPSHLLDEDSQSSVKSSTNDSNKLKKSKFADLFDSNKVWTAADVKEYMWPPPENTDGEHQVMMIQEQVAMFLGVKSFKRRYPELKRRTITAEERDYVLRKGLVTEALCDLGITAVDASEVLDIMLSDYPHKYEEFRSHQREKQLAEPVEDTVGENQPELKIEKLDVKDQKADQKPEAPKVDPEKTRQDMAAAAIASASEWNARMNALRRPACADLQSLTVQRRRPPPPPPRLQVRPPAGFYPHALLPGQYQHSYRVYTPEQLRYFPLNTALAAPPAPPSPAESSSDSEPEWGSRLSSSDDSDDAHRTAKRKKLTKTKRISQTEVRGGAVVKEEEVDTCRTCKLRLEANRKYTHERFLVCANCNAKLHPSCVDLGPDTIRKCREYAWQCAECKTCCSCSRPADDDKMLFCDLCDRGFHIYCVGLDTVPTGRWHCVECSICKSCGARSPGGLAGAGAADGPADWHHQTRRGPGGHKVYSHSLCTPCARAYRIGRYCPLCDRSFIGPKGTMQLVICKLCDRQLHQECVKQTVSALNVLDYTCGECRRGGITSRAAAVRLAPRTIATLFMAKRRFNKYAHRQYLQSRARERDFDPPDDSHDPLDSSLPEPDATDPPSQ